LNTVGSLIDIEQLKDVLEEEMKVLLYMTNEFEVYGTLVFEEIWLGIPDFDTIRYYNTDDAPK
jgi:hypothetical protein